MGFGPCVGQLRLPGQVPPVRMQERGPERRVSMEDIRVLARIARLPVVPERAPRLAEQLDAALLAARDVAEVAHSTPSVGTEEFDPSWPDQDRSRSR